MTGQLLVDALALPPAARVSHRVPKRSLAEHGALTAADRRLIERGIEDVHWVAALKPGTTAISSFKDEVRDYGEIVVLAATLRDDARAPRVLELIHRAVPYPVVLCAEQAGRIMLSLAHKRASQAAAGAVVVEGVTTSPPLPRDGRTSSQQAFLAALALSAQPAADLLALYQAWLDRVVDLQAAELTGTYSPARSAAASGARRAAIAEHERISRELARLRAQATRERQLARRVELNLTIKRLESELAVTDRSL